VPCSRQEVTVLAEVGLPDLLVGTLNIHPNTLRHRVRKAVAMTGIDLDDPEPWVRPGSARVRGAWQGGRRRRTCR
jgi:hypothetical protein